MIRRVIARANIEDLEGKIRHAIVRKNQVQNHLNELKKRYSEKHLSLHQLNHELEKELDGRTLEEWIKHYDYYISYCKLLIRKKEREIRNSKILVAGLSIIFILALSLFAIRSGPSFVGFSVQDTDSGDSASGDTGSDNSDGGGSGGASSGSSSSSDSNDGDSGNAPVEDSSSDQTSETPTEESLAEEEVVEEATTEETTENLDSGNIDEVDTLPQEEILEENNETAVEENTEEETEAPSSGGGSGGENIILTEKETEGLNGTGIPDLGLNETSSSLNQTVTNETLLNETVVEEIVVGETNITTVQYGAVLGKPVKWKKTITLEEAGPVTITIPENAENISVIKVVEDDDSIEEVSGEVIDEEILEDGLNDQIENETLEIFEEKDEEILERDTNENGFEKNEEEIKIPEVDLEKVEAEFQITGKVVVGGASLTASDSKIIGWIKDFFSRLAGSFTGRAIQDVENEIIEELEIEILDNATEYEVEYETSAPYSIETEDSDGKTVKIVGPEEVHYQNVLSFTELSNSLKITNPLGVRIYWEENNTYLPTTLVEDLDSDGFYDYVEWITPHLSNQTFKIIVITKAIHLDENKTLIRDIYGYVNAKDDNWTYIPKNEWVRVTFEIPLDETRDITLYARSNVSNATVEVYYFNTSDNSSKVLTFPTIENESYYKVYLTGLNGTQDTFDLKIINGIEIDLIIDPILDPITGWVNKSFSSPGNQNDRAEDVVVDRDDMIYTVGWGYNLTGTGSNDDWWVKKFYKNGTEVSTNDGWNKTFDFFNESDRAYGVAVDSNNDVYVVGYVSNSTGNLSDQHLRAYYPNGTEKWNITIDYATLNDVFWSVAVDSVDSIYAVGYGTDARAAGDAKDVTVRKYYANGTEWGGNFPLIHGSVPGDDEEALDVAIDSYDNFTITGYGTTEVGVGKDWMFGRFDSSGNKIFNQVAACPTLGSGIEYDCYDNLGFGAGKDQIVNATKHDPNNDNFYIAGSTAATTTNRFIALIWKFYPNRTRVGNLAFNTNIATGNSWFNEIYVDNSSNIYAVGAWENSTEWRVYYLNSTLGRVNNITDRAYSSSTLAAANGIWLDSLQDMYVAGFGVDLTPTWGSTSGEDWLLRKFEANYTESDFVVRFIDSTKTNNSESNLTYITANFTMSHRYVDNIIYNFNGTNYTIFNESLVLGYNFDNNTNFLDGGGISRKVYDISIYKNNGTQNASFDPYVSGKYGTAFNTTAGTTYFNSTNNNQTLNMTGKNVTVSAWIKPDYMPDRNGVIVTRGNASYMLGIFNLTTDGGCTTGDVFFSSANGTVIMNCSTTALSMGTWYHVVAVQEGPLNSKIYINGVEATESGTSGTPEPIIHHDEANSGVIVGGGATPTGYGSTDPFFGSIDELFIFDRPLSAGEVRHLYQTNYKKVTEGDFVVTVNQTTDNSGSELPNGNYTFYGWGEFNNTPVSSNGSNWTGIYWINFNPDRSGPSMSFVSPTYDNLTAINQGWFPVNVSINKASLDRLYYKFNGTNYTLLDEDLMILYNFDNRSTLGEDSDNFTNVLTFVPGTYRQWNASCTNCPTLTTSGLYGNAYTFDGVNDLIKIHNDTTMFSSGWAQGTNWTIKGAFKSNYSHDGIILSWNTTGSADYFVIGVNTGGSLFFKYSLRGAGLCLGQTGVSGGGVSIFDNNWHDFIVHHNWLSNTTDIILDGYSPGGSSPDSCNSNETFSIADGWEIGGDSQYSGSNFNGSIDEIYIYNRTIVGTSNNTERTQITRYQITKQDPSNWTFYINQTNEGHKQDNIDWPLGYGNLTYDVFARAQNDGVWNSTNERTIKSNPKCQEQFSTSGQEIGLVADMNCGGVEALSLGASNITLNCNGYTLNGSVDGGNIVLLTGSGYTNWTIKNCNFNLGLNNTIGFSPTSSSLNGRLNNSNFTGGVAFNTTGNFSWSGYSKLNNTVMKMWSDGFVSPNNNTLNLNISSNATLQTYGKGFLLSNPSDQLNLTGGILNVTTYEVSDAGFTINNSASSILLNSLLVHTHGVGAAIEGQLRGGTIDGGQFKEGIAIRTTGTSTGDGENLQLTHQHTPLNYIRLEDALINLTGGSYLSFPLQTTNINQTGSRIHFYGSRPIFFVADHMDFGGIEITNHNVTKQPFDLAVVPTINISNIRNLNGSGPGANSFVGGGTYYFNNVTFNTTAVNLRANGVATLSLKDTTLNGIYNFTSIANLVLNTSLYGYLAGTAININGTNLSAGFRIENNSITANSTLVPGFNRSWNLALLGLNAWSISNREIHKDGVLCTDCYNFTALDAAVVTFNVAGFSTYSIGSGGGNSPTVSSVDTISAQTPTEGGLKAVTFSFNVTDADGISDINFTSTKANFSYTSETPRTNSSCINTINYTSVNTAQFSCTVSMFYYDAPVDWRINVSISDLDGNFAYNDSKNMTYNTLYAFTMSPTNLSWPTIYASSTNVGSSNDPLTLNNTGNANGLAINITAYNLRGTTSPTQFIYADNFTVGASNSCPEGTEPTNATEVIISGATLNRGGDSSGTEDIYFCIDGIPTTNLAQEYTSSAYGEWIIEIISGSILVLIKKIFSLMFGTLALVVAIRPKGKKRENKELTKAVSLVMDVVKRNNSLGDSEAVPLLYKIIRGEKYEIKDELINSLTALIKGVKEEYSLDEESLIEMFVDTLGKRYGLNKKVVKKLGGRISTHVSLSIFSTELGALEALVKYMKENLKMDYSEISEQLGRDYKTVWTAYSMANEKKKTEIQEKEGVQIPLSIFNKKDLTIFEAVVLYLNKIGMKYSEMGELLNRDQRNMWTICSRAKKKI